MDDGNAELSDKLSDNVVFSNPESCSNFQASTSVNNTVTELSNSTTTRTCTHTHTCNPPGPDDATHTHTCYHTHTQVIASEDDTNSKPKRPPGNREAVRKYREKKKAQTAYLEEEVKKLRLVNQQLVRKLEKQALLEAELSRLRNILVHLKGKVDSEFGFFPFGKQSSSSVFKEGDTTIGLQCQNNLRCFHPHTGSPSSQVETCRCGKPLVTCEGKCQNEIVDCQMDANNMSTTEGQIRDAVDNFMSSASQDEG